MERQRNDAYDQGVESMIDIYYQNSRGQKISLVDWPVWMQTGDILDWQWDYTTAGNRIVGFSKKPVEKTITVTICVTSNQEYHDILNMLLEMFETDIRALTPGRFYVNGSYLECYIFGSTKAEWEADVTGMDVEFKIITDKPDWVTENTQQFQAASAETPDSKKYTYRFPYRYGGNSGSSYLTNSDFADSNFTLVIYGPVANPQIRIGGYPYLVNETLDVGEYIRADSRSRTIVKVAVDGTETSIFGKRQMGVKFFRKIPPGMLKVEWTGLFTFEVTLYEERSEPKWT